MTYTSIPYLTRYVIENTINGIAHAYLDQSDIRTSVIGLIKKRNDGEWNEEDVSFATFNNVEIVTEEEAEILHQRLLNMHAKHLLST